MTGEFHSIRELASKEHKTIRYGTCDGQVGIWLSHLWWDESEILRLEQAIAEFKKEQAKLRGSLT